MSEMIHDLKMTQRRDICRLIGSLVFHRFLILSFALGLFCFALVSDLNAKELPPAHKELTIQSGGLWRQCLVHLPPTYDKAKPLPLVIMLHGMGGTGLNAVRETGWSAKADAENFIVAYPDASRPDAAKPPNLKNNPQAWNDGSGRFHCAERKIDDVAFIRALIERIIANYNVDQKLIYVTGFSNGASMALRVGAELSDRVAAIAPVAGACWLDKVNLKRGISVCYITGTADFLNPMDGGIPKMAFRKKVDEGKSKPAVQDTIDLWTKALSCPEGNATDEKTPGVRIVRYGPGRDGAQVVFIAIDGHGHIWPGGVNFLPEFVVGKSSDKLNATDVIWDFFKG